MKQYFVKGEILFKNGLKVCFTGYIGQRMDTIKYYDSSGIKVPFERIIGKCYEYFKIDSNQGTRYEYDSFIGIWEKLH